MATLLPDAKSASENATNATSTRATATSATISVESTAVSRTLSTATTSNVITTDNSTAGTEATGTQDKVKQPVSTKASVHSATPTNAVRLDISSEIYIFRLLKLKFLHFFFSWSEAISVFFVGLHGDGKLRCVLAGDKWTCRNTRNSLLKTLS